LREALRVMDLSGGIDPEALWDLSEEMAYKLDITWSGTGGDSYYDVIFRRPELAEARMSEEVSAGSPTARDVTKPLTHYANNPLRAEQSRSLVPELKKYLGDKLPEYMIPSKIVVLVAMPLTPNGKLDRRALPAPDQSRPQIEKMYAAPRTSLEEALAVIFSEVL